MLGLWRAQETEEGLRGWLLGVQVKGTQGRGTGAPGEYGDLGRHGNRDGRQGYLVRHTCGKELREKDEDG